MRPLLFVLGLVFAVTVLISNINAIKCFVENPDEARHEADCDDRAKEENYQEFLDRIGATGSRPTQCGTATVDTRGGSMVYRDCLVDEMCDLANVHCTTRCSEDYCNSPDAPSEGSGNDNGIKCYVENPNEARRKVDCDERMKEPGFRGRGKGRPNQCGIAEVDILDGKLNRRKVIYRDCLVDKMCDIGGVHCTTRCSEDYCNGNGATTSAPHVLIVAVVASAIAALGI
ncbi:hypothetical protein AAVH_03557 [Aphelenchoides avenae]|nr:hypothetical protein AAVH_03557 [Aphelenchus avenae]